MTFEELAVAKREANDKLGELYVSAANRELKDDEKQTELNLSRELKMIKEAMSDIAIRENHEKALGDQRNENLQTAFRELLKDVRTNPGKAQREILLSAGNNSDGTSNVTGNIDASGAIRLTIHDLIPTLHEGLDLPEGLNIITGVTGNEIWPVSISDVEMEEVGEIEALSDQVLNFANITPTVRRCGLTVPVSNMAIDNAAFDLMSFVQTKFTLALRKYLAKKIYSQAAWAKNKGPFSGLTPKGTITIGSGAYKSILKAVAEFSDKGFYEGGVVLIMDRATEAELKATPKIEGAAGGFVIENGLCAGYPYVLTHYINTTLSGSNLVPTADKCIGIGYFEWFALQQHGDVRFVIDPITQADKNVTRLILNTAWSMTDLSTHINGGTPVSDGHGGYTYPTQAFALYEVVGGDESQSDI